MSKWTTCVAAAALTALTACAAPYRVIPTTHLEPLPPAAAGKKVHGVSVDPVGDTQGQYSRPKFKVSVRNNGSQPLSISTDNIEVELNGNPAKVMSFDAQVDELLNIINYRRASSFGFGYGSPFYQYHYGFPPFYRIGRGGDPFASVDVQSAIYELQLVRKNALKPTVLQPGQEVQGEITVLDKLPAQKDQDMRVVVTVGTEAHAFKFALQQLSR